MNSNASSDEEYGSMELDERIETEFFDLLNSDEKVDMIMLYEHARGNGWACGACSEIQGLDQREKSD